MNILQHVNRSWVAVVRVRAAPQTGVATAQDGHVMGMVTTAKGMATGTPVKTPAGMTGVQGRRFLLQVEAA